MYAHLPHCLQTKELLYFPEDQQMTGSTDNIQIKITGKYKSTKKSTPNKCPLSRSEYLKSYPIIEKDFILIPLPYTVNRLP